MFAKFATALPAAAAMTFLLLFGMQSLIAMQPGAAVETQRSQIPDFRYIPKKEEIRIDEPKPKKIPDPLPLPPIAPTSVDPTENPGPRIVFDAPPPGPRDNLSFNPGFSDGPLVAIVRVAPTYPSILSAKGIEGWVSVIFDVLPDGSVANIAVLNSSHSGFERSAVRAASRFRFKARVVDGVPQPSSGIQYRFTYELEK